MATTAQDDAYQFLLSMFKSYGLGALAPKILQYVQEGYSPDTISVLLQETAEWKQRFVGNELRRKKGLPVLSPAEYLSVEQSYRQVIRQYGLPKGFSDDPADFAKFMEADTSAMELQTRLEMRKQVVTNGALSGVLDYARRNFGLGTGDLIAYWIDPDRALPLLEQVTRASQIGAAAALSGFGDLDRDIALRLGALGIEEAQARAGFQEIAGMGELTRTLPGQQDSAAVTDEDLIGAAFEGSAGAAQKVKRAQQTRLAPFEGGGGFASTREGFSGLGTAET